MTQVDFYIISEKNPQSEDAVTCRLVLKALEQDYKILILGKNNKHLQYLDSKLWTFSEKHFVPHEIVSDEATQTFPGSQHLNVVLSETDSIDYPANLLINLSGKVPVNASRFERIAEIVPPDNAARGLSRSRFKHYRENKCELTTHEI